MFSRQQLDVLVGRLNEPRRRIQILFGPRQSGKTTLANQAIDAQEMPCIYLSADVVQDTPDFPWLEHHWNRARSLTGGQSDSSDGTVLFIDEIQKIPGWSGLVKHLWDEDTRTGVPLKLVLLGSSPLLMRRGLTESLAGRFEQIQVMHWSYREMRDAFGWDLETFIYFGGYPGAVDLIHDESRWSNFIADAIIEPTISRDVVDLAQINKPALLRQLFELGCEYSGQIVAYNKLLGQLQDAGNTTTLAHYLELLDRICMLVGLNKFNRGAVHRRSIPKLNVFNTALMNAAGQGGFGHARSDNNRWGRVVESAVGAHLLNTLIGTGVDLFYWRDRDKEVDFVLCSGDRVIPLEVKSGRSGKDHSGLAAFRKRFNPENVLLIGGGGVPLEEFFLTPVPDLFQGHI